MMMMVPHWIWFHHQLVDNQCIDPTSDNCILEASQSHWMQDLLCPLAQVRGSETQAMGKRSSRRRGRRSPPWKASTSTEPTRSRRGDRATIPGWRSWGFEAGRTPRQVRSRRRRARRLKFRWSKLCFSLYDKHSYFLRFNLLSSRYMLCYCILPFYHITRRIPAASLFLICTLFLVLLHF